MVNDAFRIYFGSLHWIIRGSRSESVLRVRLAMKVFWVAFQRPLHSTLCPIVVFRVSLYTIKPARDTSYIVLS